jgi:FkbM family methyltransferase
MDHWSSAADTGACVLCVATGGYALVWPECLQSHDDYARRFKLQYELISTVPPGGPNPKWLKLERAAALLEAGRDVMLIDADAQLLSGAPCFLDVLARHPEADVFAAKGVSGRPNSGVVFFRGGSDNLAAQLLRTCLAGASSPVPVEDRVTAEGENGHFIHFLKQAPFAAALHVLGSEWNRTAPPSRAGDAVAHYTGAMRLAYIATLEHRSFKSLETDRHPLLDHLESPAPGDHAAMLSALEKEIGSARLRVLAEAYERGARLAPPPVVHETIVSALWRIERATGWLERPTRLLMERLISPGDTAVDVGAHIGYFTEVMLRRTGPGGRVVAFEPHPKNFAMLRKAHGGAAAVFRRALGCDRREAMLYFGRGHSNHSLTPSDGRGGATPVAVTTLDHAAVGLKLPPLDFLKCDAEGSELEILLGGEGVLRAATDLKIVIEINPRRLGDAGASPGAVLHQLDRCGYAMWRINDDYSLGPENKVTGGATANYFASRKSTFDALRLGRNEHWRH